MRTEPFLYLLSSAPSNDDELYTSPDLKDNPWEDNHSDSRMIRIYCNIFFNLIKECLKTRMSSMHADGMWCILTTS